MNTIATKKNRTNTLKSKAVKTVKKTLQFVCITVPKALPSIFDGAAKTIKQILNLKTKHLILLVGGIVVGGLLAKEAIDLIVDGFQLFGAAVIYAVDYFIGDEIRMVIDFFEPVRTFFSSISDAFKVLFSSF